MKVAVYSIALNEKSFLKRWYASAKEADYILIADTGSTDGLVKAAKKLGINTFEIKVVPWRFDDAKNSALSLLPADIDIAVSMDMDEVLLPGWREELEKSWESDATILNHKYRHNGGAWQWHSKIHARKGCRWTGAVHETLTWAGDEKTLWSSNIFLDEWQDTTKSRKSYLNLLHKKIKEGDTDWRTRYFLANDYQNIGNLDSAIFWRSESYAACTEGPIVKSYIAKNIAANYQEQGNVESALQWLGTGLEQSKERETLFAIAKLHSAIGNHQSAYNAIIDCLAITEKRDGFTYDAAAWGAIPYDLRALSAYYIGKPEEALEYGKKALELDPENQRLLANLKWYEEANDK